MRAQLKATQLYVGKWSNIRSERRSKNLVRGGAWDIFSFLGSQISSEVGSGRANGAPGITYERWCPASPLLLLHFSPKHSDSK